MHIKPIFQSNILHVGRYSYRFRVKMPGSRTTVEYRGYTIAVNTLVISQGVCLYAVDYKHAVNTHGSSLAIVTSSNSSVEVYQSSDELKYN